MTFWATRIRLEMDFRRDPNVTLKDGTVAMLLQDKGTYEGISGFMNAVQRCGFWPNFCRLLHGCFGWPGICFSGRCRPEQVLIGTIPNTWIPCRTRPIASRRSPKLCCWTIYIDGEVLSKTVGQWDQPEWAIGKGPGKFKPLVLHDQRTVQSSMFAGRENATLWRCG